tara:strand:+ start:524 stop:958 length:435 start_codon:yes stop_codon:yes gene_type:complete
MSRAGVLSTIDSLISGVSSPTFTAVYQGEPLQVPTTPIAAFWISSQSEDFQTLGDASTTLELMIQCYWRQQLSPNVRESIELEIYDAIVSIKTALRGDSNLSGNCTDSRPGTATVGIQVVGGTPFRTLSIPFFVDVYGEETITP